MPTSPTGADGRSSQAGFTLVELMIVVAIIGLVSGVVVLSLPDNDRTLRRAAETLAARIAVARDMAIVDGRATSLVLDAGGYGFAQRSGGVARPMVQRGLRRDAWPEGVSALVDGRPGGQVRFDPTGIADPAVVTLSRDSARLAVRVAADGDVDVEN